MTIRFVVLRLMVLSLSSLTGAVACTAQGSSTSPQTPSLPTADATLYQRLRAAYSDMGYKDGVMREELASLGKEAVEGRDQFVRRLFRWTAGLPKDESPEILIIEVVSGHEGGPTTRYRSVVLLSVSDKAFATLQVPEKLASRRVDSRAWQLIKQYAMDAADAGTVGRFAHVGQHVFRVALLSYFDGRQWHASEFRDYDDLGFLAERGAKKLISLQELLFFAVNIDFFAPLTIGDDKEVNRRVDLLRAMRERTR